MSPDSDPIAPDANPSVATNLNPDGAKPSPAAQPIDARGATGVQIGEGSTQFIYEYYRPPDAEHALPPAMSVSGPVQSPYRGLHAFNERDAVFFFGRDDATTAILERMSAQLEATGPLVVSGVSGAGKSSLLQAGVLPRLRGTGLKTAPEAMTWPCVYLTPGPAPLDDLAVAVAPLAGADSADVRQSLASDPRRFRLTARQAAGSRHGDGSQPRLVLMVDGLEKLFTQCQDESEREAFLNAMASATTAAPGQGVAAVIILGVRADFEARCAEYPSLKDAIQSRYLVTSMTDRQLELAITEPPKRLGALVDYQLVEALLRELKVRGKVSHTTESTYGAGVLPLLSHALDEAWRRRVDPKTLTLADYEIAGGIEGAVRNSADSTYAKLTPKQQAVARRVFIRLTTTTADGVDTADRVERDDLTQRRTGAAADDVEAVLEAFAAERLLTLGSRTVEISHEVLLTAWPLLHDNWLAETHADRVERSRLRNAADEWIHHNRDPSYLYRGSLLHLAAETVDRIDADPTRQPSISKSDREFLNASLRLRQQAARRRRAFTVSLVVLVLAIGLVAAIAVVQQRAAQTARRAAEQQLRIATARQLISEARASIDEDPIEALQLGVAAQAIEDNAETRASLVTSLISTPLARVLRPSDDLVEAVVFSPDGRLAADCGDAHACHLWSTAGNHLSLVGSILEQDDVNSVAFSRDGKLLVCGMANGTVRLWSLVPASKATPLGPAISAHHGQVRGVRFGPRRTMISVGDDRMVRLWKIGKDFSLDPIGPSQVGHRGSVRSVAVNSHGIVVTGGGDATMRIWKIAHGLIPLGPPIKAHRRGMVRSLAFSDEEDQIVASAGDDRTVRVWRIDRSNHLLPLGGPLIGHQDEVTSVMFNPRDSHQLASVSDDQDVKLWDRDGSHFSLSRTLSGAHDELYSVAFDPGGSILLAGARNGEILVYDLTQGKLPHFAGPPILGHEKGVDPVVFDPTGLLVANGSEDGILEVFNVRNGSHPVRVGLLRNEDEVTSLAFSPVERDLLAVGIGATVRLWKVHSGGLTPLGDPSLGHEDAVVSLAFCGGKNLLVGGYEEGIVRLWKVDSQAGAVPVGQPFRGNDVEVDSVACSPDGQILAVAGKNSVNLWKVSEDSSLVSFGSAIAVGQKQAINSVAFNADSSTLATAGDNGVVTIWDLQGSAPAQVGPPLRAHGGPVTSVAFSPTDKELMVTGGQDKTLIIWDLSTSSQPLPLAPPLEGHKKAVNSVAIGRPNLIGSGGEEGWTLLWNISELIAIRSGPVKYACARAGLGLDRDEWMSKISTLPYRQTCPG